MLPVSPETIKKGFLKARTTLSHAPVRLRALLAVLVLVSACAMASRLQTWRLENELMRVAEGIVADFNTESPVALGEEASADTTCEVFCSYKYLVLGPVTGKIVFSIAPKCYADHRVARERLTCAVCSDRSTYHLDYVYLRGTDGWEFYESYLSRPPFQAR